MRGVPVLRSRSVRVLCAKMTLGMGGVVPPRTVNKKTASWLHNQPTNYRKVPQLLPPCEPQQNPIHPQHHQAASCAAVSRVGNRPLRHLAHRLQRSSWGDRAWVSEPLNDLLTTTLDDIRIKVLVMGPVVHNQDGASYRSFWRASERAVRNAAISDCTFHDLWHTFSGVATLPP